MMLECSDSYRYTYSIGRERNLHIVSSKQVIKITKVCWGKSSHQSARRWPPVFWDPVQWGEGSGARLLLSPATERLWSLCRNNPSTKCLQSRGRWRVKLCRLFGTEAMIHRDPSMLRLSEARGPLNARHATNRWSRCGSKASLVLASAVGRVRPENKWSVIGTWGCSMSVWRLGVSLNRLRRSVSFTIAFSDSLASPLAHPERCSISMRLSIMNSVHVAWKCSSFKHGNAMEWKKLAYLGIFRSVQRFER